MALDFRIVREHSYMTLDVFRAFLTYLPILSHPITSDFGDYLGPPYLSTSDESEPSWLEPELELKDFQLGSARLVTFLTSARN